VVTRSRCSKRFALAPQLFLNRQNPRP